MPSVLTAGSTRSSYLSSSDAVNTLRRQSRYEDYYLSGVSSGTRVRVNMSSGFDNYLQILDAYGNLIASDDDSGTGLNARLDFVYQYGFRIRATAYYGGTGSYSRVRRRRLAISTTVQRSAIIEQRRRANALLRLSLR